MNIGDVMEALATRLNHIEGLRTHGYPVGKVSPPAAVVGYPESYTFDSTYQRGADDITIPIVVVVGGVLERSTRDRLADYAAGSGPKSVKAIVESGEYIAFGTVRVASVELDTVMIGAVEYLAAIFSAVISGEGEQST